MTFDDIVSDYICEYRTSALAEMGRSAKRGAYSMGIVNSVNTLLDNSAALPYETRVLEKSESHSSKGTRYFLRVARWGPVVYPEDVDVPMHTYNTTRVGDTVCYGLHPGFLHGPWYVSISCMEQPAPPRDY